MKIFTSYKLRVAFFLLSAFCFLPSALNAQIEINELNLTPEMEEMLIAPVKNFLEKSYSKYGIKNKEQLENLHFGKPIPNYSIVSDVNKMLMNVNDFNVSLLSDNEPLSLRFIGTWNVPVMFDEEPFLFGVISFDFRENPSITNIIKNTIKHFHNYEHKDSIIGSVCVIPSSGGMDHLIIKKENQDIFVKIYDETTDEYFNEYSLSELINHLKELNLRAKETRMRYFDKVANKSELEITPEITEIVITGLQNMNEMFYSNFGITNRAQLDNLHLEKPIPMYILENENLIFSGRWQVPVMSADDPIYLATVRLENDGQYIYAGGGGAKGAEIILNYEHKDLIIGFLGTRSFSGKDYLIIRKENQDIYVQMYDYATRESFKNEFTFSEIINLIKE